MSPCLRDDPISASRANECDKDWLRQIKFCKDARAGKKRSLLQPELSLQHVRSSTHVIHSLQILKMLYESLSRVGSGAVLMEKRAETAKAPTKQTWSTR